MPNDISAKGAAKGKADKPKPDKGKVERTGGSFIDKISKFCRESYIEVVKKAAWPTWPELKKFTTVVIMAVLVVAIYIGVLDYGLARLTDPWLRAASGK